MRLNKRQRSNFHGNSYFAHIKLDKSRMKHLIRMREHGFVSQRRSKSTETVELGQARPVSCFVAQPVMIEIKNGRKVEAPNNNDRIEERTSNIQNNAEESDNSDAGSLNSANSSADSAPTTVTSTSGELPNEKTNCAASYEGTGGAQNPLWGQRTTTALRLRNGYLVRNSPIRARYAARRAIRYPFLASSSAKKLQLDADDEWEDIEENEIEQVRRISRRFPIMIPNMNAPIVENEINTSEEDVGYTTTSASSSERSEGMNECSLCETTFSSDGDDDNNCAPSNSSLRSVRTAFEIYREFDTGRRRIVPLRSHKDGFKRVAYYTTRISEALRFAFSPFNCVNRETKKRNPRNRVDLDENLEFKSARVQPKRHSVCRSLFSSKQESALEDKPTWEELETPQMRMSNAAPHGDWNWLFPRSSASFTGERYTEKGNIVR